MPHKFVCARTVIVEAFRVERKTEAGTRPALNPEGRIFNVLEELLEKRHVRYLLQALDHLIWSSYLEDTGVV